MIYVGYYVFCFKQKTAYERRISDWSSDVCSSDLFLRTEGMSYLEEIRAQIANRDFSKLLQLWEEYCTSDSVDAEEYAQILEAKIGRASCRERGCQYV